MYVSSISFSRSVAALQENLSVLGDKLEGPRQDLEQAKKDEAERKGKIEKMRLEIEVREVFGLSQLSRTYVMGVVGDGGIFSLPPVHCVLLNLPCSMKYTGHYRFSHMFMLFYSRTSIIRTPLFLSHAG